MGNYTTGISQNNRDPFEGGGDDAAGRSIMAQPLRHGRNSKSNSNSNSKSKSSARAGNRGDANSAAPPTTPSRYNNGRQPMHKRRAAAALAAAARVDKEN